ncbi:hypothetical protein [Sulfitobacter sp.]|uniref:hypothetical protein n=1 Tax=Sulfitobacter sp. TaxID=1903071 RepID=UPI0035669899|tara:strand:+ start:8909 stop:9202 length:294 start_codon:yes stop_codon:yes gene_type:complete
MDNSPRTSPLLAGLALVGAGLVLRQIQPSVLSLPEPDKADRNDHGVRRAARKSRDGLAGLLPKNLTGSIGRSLMIMGLGLVTIRALDAIVDDKDALY